MVISLQATKKLWAALVMICALAVILSAWAGDVAGRRALQGEGCTMDDLRPWQARIELRQSRIEELGRNDKADCLIPGMAAQLEADWFFLLSYGPLNFAMFLLVLARGKISPGLSRILLIFGALLTVAMVTGDISENATLLQLIHHPLDPAPGGPIVGSLVKWGSLAVASATLGVLYLLPPVRPGTVILALIACGAAALPAWGLIKGRPDFLNMSLLAFGIFWIAVLIHAIVVATASTPPIPSAQPAAKETAR
ncbi:MAG TPA: hypothetical protein VH988_13910 [Thermoanaerobaculia bacterium]|jgi:hypothetical protein|nr:hypothetical protein [Thermoanaerobaculia bacterium]